ncbi:oligosaccharide flippase family protein [Patescibacteria group bacterium]
MFTGVINLIKEQRRNPAIYGTVIISTGIMVGSVFSYLLQFFLGRMLSPSDYGTFNALLSLGILVGAPAGILSTSLIKISSELLAKNNFDKLTALFWKLVGMTSFIGILFFCIFWLLKFRIAEYLNISDVLLISIFGLFASLSLVRVVPLAYLQGLLRFKGLAFSSVVIGFSRFFLTVLAVYLGFQLRGAVVGLFLTGILSIFITTLVLKKNLTKKKPIVLNDYFRKILSFSLPVFFIQFGLMALNNVDVVLVKRYFDSDTAGFYSGTVTLGKIFLFGATMVATVMFPQISNLYAKRGDYIQRFKQFLIIQFVLVLAGTIVYLALPRLITLIFFGERFLASVEYLPKFSIFVALYALTNFLVIFFLAIERKVVSLFLTIAVVVQFFLINTFHSSLDQIININILVVAMLHLVLWLYYVSFRHRSDI